MPPAVAALAAELGTPEWVTDLFVAGSVATGDHRPGVSDIDLVALIDGPMDAHRRSTLVDLHRALDTTTAGADLGCAYVAAASLSDPARLHPTWTHGRLVDRTLSGITRAELVRYGHAVLGRAPAAVLPAMGDDDVRRAARTELTGYWATVVRRPWWLLDKALADLALTSMARARHTMATGELVTKSAAIDAVRAPGWLRTDLRVRRGGGAARSPRVRTAWIAWSDVRRTVAAARDRRAD